VTAPRIYSLAEAAALPEPEPLVEGLLFANGYSALVGPSGVGKSFVAIALAAAIASRQPFIGRKTVSGSVVWVGPEGFSTFRKRALAAMEAAGLSALPNLFLVPDAVYLHDAASITAFCAVLQERVPEPIGLIVFDTLAKCSAGMDENSNSDRELTNAGIDYIRKQTGAHCMVIHHTGWDETRERGATALRAAVDTLLHLKKDEGAIVLTATKQRDIESGATLRLALTPFADSQIVTMPGDAASSDQLPEYCHEVLKVLADISTSEGVSTTTWMRSATQGTKLSERSFYRARKQLLAKSYAMQVYGGKRYAVAPEGQDLLSLPNNCQVLPLAVTHTAATTAGGRSPRRAVSSGRDHSVTDSERGDAWEPEAVRLA
jgi:hypothetical protein